MQFQSATPGVLTRQLPLRQEEEISFPMKSLPPGREGVVVSKHREWQTGPACIGVVFTV